MPNARSSTKATSADDVPRNGDRDDRGGGRPRPRPRHARRPPGRRGPSAGGRASTRSRAPISRTPSARNQFDAGVQPADPGKVQRARLVAVGQLVGGLVGGRVAACPPSMSVSSWTLGPT